MTIYLCFFGFISGITTVLFGFGGGFITVPLLYMLLTLTWGANSEIGQFAIQIAVATSACVMIFSASVSTMTHSRAGNLDWSKIRPLLTSISLGGALGAFAALSLNGDWVRWIFIGYLVVTILDCFVRPGFLQPVSAIQNKQSTGTDPILGVIIGAIAAFLGVGGSVMTVPLMRRRGATMMQAAAMANPLTLPLAITGTLTYLFLSLEKNMDFGDGFIGFLYLKGALLLIASSWLGIKFASLFMRRISDAWHARIYPFLLFTVLCAMIAT